MYILSNTLLSSLYRPGGYSQLRKLCPTSLWLLPLLILLPIFTYSQEPSVELPGFALRGVPFSGSLHQLPDSADIRVAGPHLTIGESDTLTLTGTDSLVQLENLRLHRSGSEEIIWWVNGSRHSMTIRVLPGFLSILPPLIAIVMALLTRQILVSLFVGIWIGAIFIEQYSIFGGLLTFLDTFLVEAMVDSAHASIILFTLAFGGMVGVLAKNGGMQGVVKKISEFASSNRSGQLATMFMGILIFFDDYANTLLVGNTMRALTDKLRISREKLSYIVDSTAAPVTTIAIISTWVGFEIGLMQEALVELGINQNVYVVFLQTIPYKFYSLFALVFVFLVAWSQRDYGAMLRAEKRSVHTGKVLRDNATPLTDTSEFEVSEEISTRWYNAIVPILTVIVVMLLGLYFSGLRNSTGTDNLRMWTIIGNADSFEVLIWASFSGSIMAIILSVGQRILSLSDAVEAWLTGVKAMVLAVAVLVLAWSLSRICSDLQTAEYIIEITRGLLSPEFIPALTFLTAAVVSFATGTSWGTMAILIPIVIPLMAQLLQTQSPEVLLNAQSFLATFAAVLSGAVFGDHCSPISDTTIMSSLASGADHIDHVKTQIPYAVLVGGVAIFVGYIPAGYHLSWPLFFSIGIVLLVLTIYIFGKPIAVRDEIDLSDEKEERE